MPKWRPDSETKRRILERDNFTCQYCGGASQQTDHVVPWSVCHVNVGNMVATCRRCNAIGGAKVFSCFEAKRAYILARREGLNMKKAKQAAVIAAGIDDIFERTEQKKRKPSPYDVKYPPASFRIKTETHSELKRIAAANSIGLNDMVRWIFGEFIKGHDDGSIELPIEHYTVSVSRLSD